nr:hypothetical protein GCM10020241_14130 [Streptoalloteichus tenebrarius]
MAAGLGRREVDHRLVGLLQLPLHVVDELLEASLGLDQPLGQLADPGRLGAGLLASRLDLGVTGVGWRGWHRAGRAGRGHDHRHGDHEDAGAEPEGSSASRRHELHLPPGTRRPGGRGPEVQPRRLGRFGRLGCPGGPVPPKDGALLLPSGLCHWGHLLATRNNWLFAPFSHRSPGNARRVTTAARGDGGISPGRVHDNEWSSRVVVTGRTEQTS